MENLKELVGVNSYEDKTPIIDLLKEKFKSCEEIVEVVSCSGEKSLIVGINCKLRNQTAIILSGHMDTVSPDFEKYATDPLLLTIKDGKGYGLGSIDMKSFVAVVLDNLEELKQSDFPIVLALTTDEETNLKCVESVVDKLKELNIMPKFSIVGEPTNMAVNTSANGCYEYLVQVYGKSCHSSLPSNGINAINIMAKIVSIIEEKQSKFGDLTSNSGVISGGDIVNRVPDFCSLKFDIRSTKKDKVQEFLAELSNEIEKLQMSYIGSKITIDKLLEIPPLEDKESGIITALVKEFGLETSKFSGGCEAGYYQSLSGDAIIFGVGDINLAHKPNEFVVIEEYYEYSKLLIKVINFLAKNL